MNIELNEGNKRQRLEIAVESSVSESGKATTMYVHVNYSSVQDLLAVIEAGVKHAKTENPVWLTASAGSMMATSKRFEFKNGEPNEDWEPPKQAE
jgi:hypothetical protein